GGQAAIVGQKLASGRDQGRVGRQRRKLSGQKTSKFQKEIASRLGPEFGRNSTRQLSRLLQGFLQSGIFEEIQLRGLPSQAFPQVGGRIQRIQKACIEFVDFNRLAFLQGLTIL